MKLVLKKGDKEMSLDVVESRVEGNVSDFIVNLYKNVFCEPEQITVDAPLSKGDSETFAEHYGCLPEKPIKDNESFTIRNRLPNNVVDISKLDIKQAVTQAALVRCPKCGQSHAIVITDRDTLYLMRRTYSTDEFDIVGSIPVAKKNEAFKVICPDGDSPKDKLNYFHDLQALFPEEDKNFNVTNETEIFCPVCYSSSSFYEWKDAYENREYYFEYQYICGVCGGECVMDAKEEKDSSEIVVCTECGKKWLKRQV